MPRPHSVMGRTRLWAGWGDAETQRETRKNQREGEREDEEDGDGGKW